MQYTPNFNLGLVEGTDLVNPMTQMNPNFTDLDTIIKALADNTITTATEVTVGTVHGLTRANTDCNVFRWVATANFNTGDTFTVDGTTVTALKTNGTILQTGEYIIGASVIAVLDGTRLTVNVAQNISQTAADISYDNTGSGLTATDVQDAIDEVNSALTHELTGTTIIDLNAALAALTKHQFASSMLFTNNGEYSLKPTDYGSRTYDYLVPSGASNIIITQTKYSPSTEGLTVNKMIDGTFSTSVYGITNWRLVYIK